MYANYLDSILKSAWGIKKVIEYKMIIILFLII